MGGPMGGPMLGMMMKDLNLTADQAGQFKALFEQPAPSMKARNPIQGLHDNLKQAFLADKFDAAGLKAKLLSKIYPALQPCPPDGSQSDKAWQILTANNRQLVTRWQRWTENAAMAAECHGPGNICRNWPRNCS